MALALAAGKNLRGRHRRRAVVVTERQRRQGLAQITAARIPVSSSPMLADMKRHVASETKTLPL